MSISSLSDSRQQLNPSSSYFSKNSPNLQRIASNINKIAVPVIAIIALTNVTSADAGPIAYAACCAACELLRGGILIAAAYGWPPSPLLLGRCDVQCTPALTDTLP